MQQGVGLSVPVFLTLFEENTTLTMSPVQRRSLLFVLLTLICLFLDLVSKAVVFHYLPKMGDCLEVIPNFFNLRHAENPGAVWGILGGQRVFLIITTVVAVAFVFWLFMSLVLKSVWNTISLGMILGGALGNLYDRIVYERVRDFLDCYIFWSGDPVRLPLFNTIILYGNEINTWPTFNVADSFLCIGVGILAILTLFERDDAKKKSDSSF